jgi:methylglyoxal synthase
MEVSKRVALVAHDNCKKDLVEWVEWNRNLLLDHQLICTGTTGRYLENINHAYYLLFGAFY